MTIDQFYTEFFGLPCDTDWVEFYDMNITGRFVFFCGFLFCCTFFSKV